MLPEFQPKFHTISRIYAVYTSRSVRICSRFRHWSIEERKFGLRGGGKKGQGARERQASSFWRPREPRDAKVWDQWSAGTMKNGFPSRFYPVRTGKPATGGLTRRDIPVHPVIGYYRQPLSLFCRCFEAVSQLPDEWRVFWDKLIDLCAEEDRVELKSL